MVYEAVKTTINDQGVVWVYWKGHYGVSFFVGRCVLREWVVGGGGKTNNIVIGIIAVNALTKTGLMTNSLVL